MRDVVLAAVLEQLPAGIFALMALVLVVLGIFILVWGALRRSYLTTLAYVLAGLCTAFAVALVYEAVAVATRSVPTISVITNDAFRVHQLVWVSLFGSLMLGQGLLAVHFTRVSGASDRLQSRLIRVITGTQPATWAGLLGIAMVVAALVVGSFSPLVVHLQRNDPGFSWWVLYVGGVAYGVGALVAWGFDWRPNPGPAASATSIALPEAGLRRRLLVAARPVVENRILSAAFFAVAALALVAFALFISTWGTLSGGYLKPLCYALGGLSVAFAVALFYETKAVATGKETISEIADDAFQQHEFRWVLPFGLLLFGFGLLATHFTRVARVSTGVVAVQTTLARLTLPVVWAVLLGASMVLAGLLVSRITSSRVKADASYPSVSWWVLFLGAATYGIGALVAWATNWAP